MFIPEWLAIIMILGFSLALIAIALIAFAYFGGILVNIIIPNLWTTRQRYKVRNMSKEKLESYLFALRHEWTEYHVKKEQGKEG